LRTIGTSEVSVERAGPWRFREKQHRIGVAFFCLWEPSVINQRKSRFCASPATWPQGKPDGKPRFHARKQESTTCLGQAMHRYFPYQDMLTSLWLFEPIHRPTRRW
jgi:hypothetical protein